MAGTVDTEYGIKKLTKQNWLEPAAVWKAFVRLCADGTPVPFTSSDFVEPLLEVRLSSNVPEQLRKLFEVARGTMIYGWFFYPLLTLGAEQAFRVAEAAVNHKCDELGFKGRRAFEKRLEWLAEQDVIRATSKKTWHAVRELRNIGSHPDSQQIFSPGMAVESLQRCAELINSLFDS